MKKLLLLTLINFIAISAFSASLGAKWRWRNNDGNEKTATWKAAQMQRVAISDDKEIRFRAQFYHEGNIQPTLYYAVPPGDGSGIGTPILITDDPNTTNAFYLVKTNAYVNHREATTSQIPVAPNNYFPGDMVYGPGIVITKLDTVRFNTTGNVTELEWCLKPTKYAAPPGYNFITNISSTNWHLSGSQNPSIGINYNYAAISTDSITYYTIKKAGADVDITWNTALQGHDHFEIEAREDTAKIFKHLATVAGGNVRSYKTTLTNSPQGIIHYRIKLFDKNKVMSISRPVKFNNEPVDVLLKFSLHPSDNNVLVKWITALNKHDHFIIQKSKDNLTFNDIDTIPGGTGQQFSTTLTLNDFNTIYVRMKLYDEDNRETISPTKKLVLVTYVDMTKFEGFYDKKTGWVQLDFSTMNEFYNNSSSSNHSFSIMKSNSKSPSTPAVRVAKLPGWGWRKNRLTNYTVYDKTPDPKFDTYKITYRQGDQIKTMTATILPPANTPALTFDIYPNPVSSGKVSFDLKGYNGKTIKAMLTNLYGKQISSETFTVNAGEKYVLKTNAAPGTYVLNVSGEGITKSGKVLVQ